MKIFLAHASSFDFKDKLYKPLRESELNNLHEIFLPQETDKEVITKDIIGTCGLVIADVSHPSTGMGIELGWANVQNVPIVCIYEKGSTPSSALTYICDKFLMYTDHENMIEDITGVLKQYE